MCPKVFRVLAAASCLMVASRGAQDAEAGAVIATMDEPRFTPPQGKGEAEQVDGKVGRATRFRFAKGDSGAFFTSNLRGTPEWDRAGGFSFWVRGDGIDQIGGLEFIYDEDYAVRYDLAFPIKGTGWTKVVVAWRDLIPVLPGPKSKPLGGSDGNAPSKLTSLWFGRWWYWRDYPAQVFDVDEIRLEPALDRDAPEDRPDGAPLRRVLARLEAGQPITIVTMGDSLTDTRHWSNREVSWPGLLRARLEGKFRSAVTVVNPAIGGTQLRQNLVLIPRWLDQAPAPDLVTVFFGGNDWDAGMRGEEFTRAAADAIDRIRRATKGRTAVLLLTTAPTADRWDETAELASACRRAALDRKAGLADIDRAFHEAAPGQADRARLYVHDRVHLSPAGHEVVAETVFKAIAASGR